MASVDDVQLGIHHFSPTFLKRSQNEDILSQNQQKTGPPEGRLIKIFCFAPPGGGDLRVGGRKRLAQENAG